MRASRPPRHPPAPQRSQPPGAIGEDFTETTRQQGLIHHPRPELYADEGPAPPPATRLDANDDNKRRSPTAPCWPGLAPALPGVRLYLAIHNEFDACPTARSDARGGGHSRKAMVSQAKTVQLKVGATPALLRPGQVPGRRSASPAVHRRVSRSSSARYRRGLLPRYIEEIQPTAY